MKKICPFILLFWPYLFLPAAYLDSLNPDGGLVFVTVYCILTPLLYLANILCACRDKDVRRLSFWDLLLKLFHVPAYVLIFFVGLIMTGSILTGVPFGLLLVPVLVAIDCLLLVTTSVYGAKALYLAGKQGKASKEFTIVNILLHFVFVLDVVSSVITFCKIRKDTP